MGVEKGALLFFDFFLKICFSAVTEELCDYSLLIPIISLIDFIFNARFQRNSVRSFEHTSIVCSLIS